MKKAILYPDLSYQIVGCAYDVYNHLGPGHKEAFYQKAMSVALKDMGIAFVEQKYYPLKFKNAVIGRQFCDFVVQNKVVVEIKKGNNFSLSNIHQVLEYLKVSNLKLAILFNFGTTNVAYKRIINEQNSNSDIRANSHFAD
ncbi:MAG: GxxExxY protein [Flavobacteriales bacterium]|nr:GxxExxY protein [Flavobacteriales bacterium]